MWRSVHGNPGPQFEPQTELPTLRTHNGEFCYYSVCMKTSKLDQNSTVQNSLIAKWVCSTNL